MLYVKKGHEAKEINTLASHPKHEQIAEGVFSRKNKSTIHKRMKSNF